MNSLQILEVLNKYEIMQNVPHFILSSDQLDGICFRPSVYIVNIEPSFKLGSHWIAIVIPYKGNAEFFDSLGKPPWFYGTKFVNFLINNGPNYVYNSKRIQQSGTDTCGLYCLYFILRRCLGRTYQEILEPFKDNLSCNEYFIKSCF